MALLLGLVLALGVQSGYGQESFSSFIIDQESEYPLSYQLIQIRIDNYKVPAKIVTDDSGEFIWVPTPDELQRLEQNKNILSIFLIFDDNRPTKVGDYYTRLFPEIIPLDVSNIYKWISGRIVNPNNNPIPGLKISIDYKGWEETGRETKTDENGTFKRWIPKNIREITVFINDPTGEYQSPDPIEVKTDRLGVLDKITLAKKKIEKPEIVINRKKYPDSKKSSISITLKEFEGDSHTLILYQETDGIVEIGRKPITNLNGSWLIQDPIDPIPIGKDYYFKVEGALIKSDEFAVVSPRWPIIVGGFGAVVLAGIIVPIAIGIPKPFQNGDPGGK